MIYVGRVLLQLKLSMMLEFSQKKSVVSIMVNKILIVKYKICCDWIIYQIVFN